MRRIELAGLALTLTATSCLEPTEVELVSATDSTSNQSTAAESESDGDSSTTDTTTSTDATGPGGSQTTSGVDTGGGNATDPTPGTEGSDSTGPAGEVVPVFMATGHMGRTTFSCDEGESWEGNRAFDTDGDPDACSEVQPVICYDDNTGCQFLDDGVCHQVETNCDCDHHPGQGLGIAYGDDWWVATFGWGPAGSVRRSQDGLTWETVLDDTGFGGLAYGNGTFVLGDRQPMRSVDDGATWQPTEPADFVAANGQTIFNVRQVGFADVDGGRFIIIATSGDNRDIMLSSDDGASWWRPEARPEACLNGTRAILAGNDALVLLGSQGVACTSQDAGETWSEVIVSADGYVGSGGVWDGTAFQWWDNGDRYRSTDGMVWTTEAMPSGLNLGAVAADPLSGKMVAVRGGWESAWYDGQEFYRSDDGLDWVTLDSAAFVGSHRIGRISLGHVLEPTCPLSGRKR